VGVTRQGRRGGQRMGERTTGFEWQDDNSGEQAMTGT